MKLSRRRPQVPYVEKTIVKPPLDPNEYKYIELENGIRAILISEPKPEEEEDDAHLAALCVALPIGGTNQAPNELGIPHLIEHCVFGGSKNYPGLFETPRFLRTRGGDDNAATHDEYTTYDFTVLEEHFEECIDRAEDLLWKPLFSVPVIYSELNAVDTEYWIRFSKDEMRYFEMFHYLIGSDHPMGLFSTGCIQSLLADKDERDFNLQEKLFAFFRRNYYAENMCVTVMSRHSLEQLETFVTNSFKRIPKRPKPPPPIYCVPRTGFPYLPDSPFYKLHKIIPSDQQNVVHFHWAVPAHYDHYREQCAGYIRYLVDRDHENGLFNHLMKLGWVFEVSFSTMEHNSGAIKFSIVLALTLYLTHEGANSVPEITRFVHQYLHKLRKTTPPKWAYDEMRRYAEFKERLTKPPQAEEHVRNVCCAMLRFPVEDVLRHETAFDTFNADHISTMLNEMTPEKCNIMIIDYRWQTAADKFDFLDEWSGVRRRIEDFPDEWRRMWVDDPEFQKFLALPTENPFMIDDLSVRYEVDPDDKVKHIGSFEGWTLFYGKNPAFKESMLEVTLTPNVFQLFVGMEGLACFQLYLEVLTLLLTPFSTYYSLCGQKVTFSPGFSFRGIASKLPTVVLHVLEVMADFKVTEEILNVARHRIAKDIYPLCYQHDEYACHLLSYRYRTTYQYTKSHAYNVACPLLKVSWKAFQIRRLPFTVVIKGDIEFDEAQQLFIDMVQTLQPGANDHHPLLGGSPTAREFDSSKAADEPGPSGSLDEPGPSGSRDEAGPSGSADEAGPSWFAEEAGPRFAHNVDVSETTDIGNTRNPEQSQKRKLWPAQPSQIYIRVLTKRPTERCSSIMNFYHLHKDDPSCNLGCMHVLSHLMKTEFHDYMRTDNRRTYDPQAFFNTLGNDVGFILQLTCQAEYFSLSEIDEKVDFFLQRFRKRIADVSASRFDYAKQHVFRTKAISESMSDARKNKCSFGYKNPRRMEALIEISSTKDEMFHLYNLHQLTHERFLTWARNVLAAKNFKFNKTSVQIVGFGKASLLECKGGDEIWQEYKASAILQSMGVTGQPDFILKPKQSWRKTFVDTVKQFKLKENEV